MGLQKEPKGKEIERDIVNKYKIFLWYPGDSRNRHESKNFIVVWSPVTLVVSDYTHYSFEPNPSSYQ